MMKRWLPLWIGLCLAWLYGCCTIPPHPPVSLDVISGRSASSIPKSVVKRGLTVGAIPYPRSRDCEKIFRRDLVYDGLIPILIALENAPQNNSMEVFPREFRLILLIEGKQVPLKPVRLEEMGYSIEEELVIETKLLQPWRLVGGARQNGFVLFDARQFGWDSEELQKRLKNAQLKIPVRKLPLPKPKDPKEIQKNPERYRGEQFEVSILF